MERLASMETFVCVVDAGSFTAASARLGIGQPAVSKAVALLEGRLGVRLLLRSTRGLRPTEAGVAFYEHARRAMDEAELADSAARGAGAGLSGRLRVCAPVTFARLHVMPRLGPFLAAHPDLAIEVVMDDRHIDIREEGIDVALRMGPLRDSAMTARRIAVGRRMVVAGASYLAQAGVPASPQALTTHECVVYSPPGGGNTDWLFRRDGERVSMALAGRVRVSAAEGLRAAVLAGMGLAVASSWMFMDELASGEVVQVLGDWTLPPLELLAVFPTGRMASAKARAVVAFLEAALNASPGQGGIVG